MNTKTAVVLCGGFATRLGSYAKDNPKSLMDIYGKPILWYVIHRLSHFDFNKIILPLGYRSNKIRDFVKTLPNLLQERIILVETGENTSIAQRLSQIQDYLPADDSFFLMNGDTYFDFDIDSMYQLHCKNDALATLAVGHVTSPWGVIVERDGKPVSFKRNAEIIALKLNDTTHGNDLVGNIFSGFSWLKTHALQLVDLKKSHNFEIDLYSAAVEKERCALYKIGQRWFPIDTAKDLMAINSNDWVLRNIQERYTGSDLKTRYNYGNRYYDDPELLKEKILNKTVIPHQLEVQPGPTTVSSLCWMKCPYCYGLSSEDSGERLPLERYIEILSQAAQGGINKFIFAGYATDPLNYKYIHKLHKVALDTEAVFGFHTKAIKISDELISQITSENIAPQSYFSVSVDAGNNVSYNKVHGVESIAKVYDKVIENIARISEARERRTSTLDLSATYLINDINNSNEEVLKSIKDLRSAGVDLIRFTFPQVPRGFDESANASYVPKRAQVLEYYDRLKPLIEAENSDACQVIIMDLDDQFSIVDKERTLPCYARFLFPSIGFDGFLAHCSESAAPHFREMSLSNLVEVDFWDAFYNYPADDMVTYLDKSARSMKKTGCRCDRKEHVVNTGLAKLEF